MHRAGGVAYERVGSVGEPVLLIHGSHVADSFVPLVREPALATRFQLVRYHRRGLGESARHAGPLGIEGQARDAVSLAEHLRLDRLHVVGHSYGAVTAIQLALDAPDLVHSLTLLEPPLPPAQQDAGHAGLLRPLIELYASGRSREAVDAFMRIVGGSGWREELEKALPGGAVQAERDAAAFFEVEVPALQGWSFGASEARRISQPVLFVIGTESGPLFEGPRDLFVSLVPRTEQVVLSGLDHMLQLRDPGRVAASIADFLARHPMRTP
jgi:pimeloyl-ACP methyl ester carboxylesterase